MTRTATNVHIDTCIRECTSCHAICVETAQACLRAEGADPRHVRLLLDCADICRTSADFLLRGSDLHAETCRVCAEICTRCADACERWPGDERMAQCALVCRSCADSCRRTAAA